MRNKIIAGNWKMNKSLGEAETLAREIVSLAQTENIVGPKIVLCVPFPFLKSVGDITADTGIAVGAQNCSEHDSGAYTGEVAANMIASVMASYVIIGHSERRQYFGETGKLLASKIDIVLKNQLTPIFCCGEPLDVREKNQHEALVRKQIEESLFHLSSEQIQKSVIAYEPVWAIGTGKTASSQQAQDMHAFIRKLLAEKYGKTVAEGITIQYGGSVQADNAKELFSQPDVDGGLIGGASLKARDFIDIVKAIH